MTELEEVVNKPANRECAEAFGSMGAASSKARTCTSRKTLAIWGAIYPTKHHRSFDIKTVRHHPKGLVMISGTEVVSNREWISVEGSTGGFIIENYGHQRPL